MQELPESGRQKAAEELKKAQEKAADEVYEAMVKRVKPPRPPIKNSIHGEAYERHTDQQCRSSASCLRATAFSLLERYARARRLSCRRRRCCPCRAGVAVDVRGVDGRTANAAPPFPASLDGR